MAPPQLLQYSSQLFLSFHCPAKIKPITILKPSAPTLILSGNCFRQGSQYNKLWFDYLSQCWKNICIIPGFLEQSWMGLDQEVDINTSEQKLKEEIAAYSNIHYLAMKTVTIDKMNITGLTKWPYSMKYINDDPASYYLHPPYKIQNKLWKIEEDKWLADVIQQHSHSITPHVICSYFSPIPQMLGEKYRILDAHTQEAPPFYSVYEPFIKNNIDVSMWISGIPNTNISGFCGKTFIGCNSRGLVTAVPGYYEGMVASVQSILM
jgi:hypothetical protein